MSLSQQALDVLNMVTGNENQQAKAKYANDLHVFVTVTESNWIQANVQQRNTVNNVNFTPTALPVPPQLTVYTLNTDTGEIVASLAPPDPSIPSPVLPPFVSAAGNGFSSLQPNTNSSELDNATVTLSSINAKIDRIMSFFQIK